MKEEKTMIPEKQVAVQLVGPDELVLNNEKEVHKPGPHQILGKVESVGLCFSDMKLLHAFTEHPRKGPIIEGIDPKILDEIPSYVPNELPTVPGHEAVVEIVAVGDGVKDYKIGERYLVQTDYRHLPTDGSKAAFGYNFEGALQQYVLMDERIITAPDGESFLIPVTEEPSASAVALVEPWACVEDAYVTNERQTIKEKGKVIIVKDGGDYDLQGLFPKTPKSVTAVGLSDKEKAQLKSELGNVQPIFANEIPEDLFDDIVYLGNKKETFELLEKTRLAERGLMNTATAGRKIGEPVMIDVGRIHYEGTRFIGTTSNKPSEAYKHIPSSGEIPDGSDVLIVGAAGPMGTMHTIRALSLSPSVKGIIATDINNDRMAMLERTVKSLADKKGIPFSLYNPKDKGNYQGKADYAIYLIPAHQILPPVIHNLKCCGILNIFAGIRAGSFAPIDMDYYVDNSLYMIGTSGSTIEDMRIVLGKVDQNVMDTNTSVAAISGMKGAIEGLRGVDSQRFHGKVIVYPQLPELGLIELDNLPEIMPDVAKLLKDGVWTKEAESALLSKNTP
jgi:threonine dehydrogenase-like Zn-dependent dehydrogenase